MAAGVKEPKARCAHGPGKGKATPGGWSGDGRPEKKGGLRTEPGGRYRTRGSTHAAAKEERRVWEFSATLTLIQIAQQSSDEPRHCQSVCMSD